MSLVNPPVQLLPYSSGSSESPPFIPLPDICPICRVPGSRGSVHHSAGLGLCLLEHLQGIEWMVSPQLEPGSLGASEEQQPQMSLYLQGPSPRIKKSQPHLAAVTEMGEKMDSGKEQGADPPSRQR